MVVAVVMGVPLASALATGSTDSSAGSSSGSTGVTIDKTATPLDGDKTTVTLEVGATQETTVSDVVFVLDKSASAEIRNEAMQMLSELSERVKEGNVIKVGVVNFEKGTYADWGCGLTELNEENRETIEKAIKFKSQDSSGTNIHAGLVAGREMLESDGDVANANKHLVLVTDGVGYLWGSDDEGAYSIYSENTSNGEENLYASHETIDWHHNAPEYYNEFLDMATWMNLHGDSIAADIAKYQVAYEAGQYKAANYDVEQHKGQDTDWSVIEKFEAENSYVPEELESETASAPDGAIYMVASEWKKISAKYNAYSYADPRYYKDGKYAWAYNAISNLGDLGDYSTVLPQDVADYDGMFDAVKSSVLYEIECGTVTDVIGEDFNLADLDSFVLTVGNEELKGTVDESAGTVTFADGDYVVTYHENGDGEDARELFTWFINIPVKAGEGLSLSYDLTLVNRSTESGSHTVPTNESAVIEYESTTGASGEKDFPEPTVSYIVNESPSWFVSKSKTATNLAKDEDGKWTSEVTLSLPSAEEKLVSDIVFVVDKSTSSRDESTDKGLEMLRELDESLEGTDATINVGIIVFDGTSHVMRELSPYDAEDVESAMGEKIPEGDGMSGTNMEAGLIAAEGMLSESDTPDARKHVIVVSDGLTRLFCSDAGETQIIFNEQYADGTTYFGEYTAWCLARGFNDGEYKVPYGSWASYYAQLENWVGSDGDQYALPFDGDSTKSEAPSAYIPYDERDEHALCVDRAFYDAYNAYLDLAKSYHCYSVLTGNTEMGKAFMDALGGGTADDFDTIYDDVRYCVDAGSKVVDVIGSGTDNYGNAYDFEFVSKADALELKVGDKTYEAVQIDENKFAFGEENGSKDGTTYPYILTYYPNEYEGGANETEKSSECFVWEINVPVTNFARVQLTYTVRLTDPQEAEGVYGKYDADGSEGHDSLHTNVVATLYPVDSEGTHGASEEFPKPTVSYEVGTVLVTPADITIYMGGTEGYESVVTDEDGTEVEEGSYDNSLPEPGFYLTLPDYLNELLHGENTGISNLSGEVYGVRFYEEGTDKSWELEMYGGSQSVADEDGNGDKHFIYRIVPAKEEQDPIRLEFKDPDTNEHYVSDEFDPNKVGNLSNSYEMGIYAGQVNQSKILMEITAGGETHTLTVQVETGTLSVRYVTGEQEDVVTDALDEIGDAEAPGDRAYAVRGEGAKFYVNESDIDVTADAAPSLLFDEVVSSDNTAGAGAYGETLGRHAIGILEDEGLESPQYQAKYLDLVDANNGNAWLTTDGDVTVYWPRPEGTDEGTKFYLVHFEGLDREMSSDPESIQQAIEDAVESGDAVEIEGVENDPTYGVRFTLSPDEDTNRVSFSPFVLVWDAGSEPDPGPGPQPTTGSLKVTKAITGDLADEGDEFTFTVTLSGTSAATGDKTYGGVEFTNGVATITLKGGESKTLTNIPGGTKYTVEETNANGYKLADSSGTTGTISAGTTKTASFTNDKSTADTPEPATARFVARKVLNGAELKAGQFTFELRDADGKVVATATNDASGTIVFDGLTFDKEGTYEFTISEVNGGSEDYTYDTSVKGCYVVVSEEDGKLVAEAFAHDDLVFTNEYVGTEDPGEPDEPDTPDTPDTPDEPGEPTTPVTPGEDVPDTGDHTNGVLPAVLALGGVALVGGALVVARRRAM